MVRKHFVAYHNADQRGPYEGDGSGGGKFETNKTSRPREGDILWCFEGAGSPKKYRLMARGLVTHITKRRDGTFLVHYKKSKQFEPTDVTNLSWFRKLAEKQGSFAFGLNSISNPTTIDQLEAHISKNVRLALIKPQRKGSIELRREQDLASPVEHMVNSLVSSNRIEGILQAIARSVEYANDLDPNKWGLRINKRGIMLKVGFVETLQVGQEWGHLLVKKDQISSRLRRDRKLEFNDHEYKHAPGCATCDFELSKTDQPFLLLWPAHAAALQIAVHGQRHTTTAKDHSPDLVDFLSKVVGRTLHQPTYLESNLPQLPPLLSLPDDRQFLEGAASQILVNRYERDSAARERCISHYGAQCVACGLKMSDRYGPEVAGLIHVHHLAPLSDVGQRLVDPITDLRPVCPNCHAVIHATTGTLRTIEQVRDLISRSERKKNNRSSNR